MSRPRDRRSEFNRQHARILAERAEREARIVHLEQERDRDIAAAVAEMEGKLRAAIKQNEELARQHAALQATWTSEHDALMKACECINVLEGQIQTLEARLDATRPEFQQLEAAYEAKLVQLGEAHTADLAKVHADIERLGELYARGAVRLRRREQEEASAALNRLRAAELVPDRDYSRR